MSKKKWSWLYDLLLVGVLLVAAYFRFTGADWGAFQNQHPDENFLSEVTALIQPIGTPQTQLGIPPSVSTQGWRAAYPKAYPDCKAWGGYFDTNCSSLNPHNYGKSFYVYGDLPIIVTRYLAGWLGQMSHLTLFGRYLSGVMDLGTIALLYFIVKRIYGPRVALLSAAFSAVAVEQIQQSHFYTTDNFVVFFMFLTLYFAVMIATWKEEPAPEGEAVRSATSFEATVIRYLSRTGRDPITYLSLAFGVALGMAAASKINAVALAITLPLALLVRYFRTKPLPSVGDGKDRPAIEDFLAKAFIFLVIGAVVSVLAFRIFQPYAFNGLGIDPQWLANIREVRAQASPNSDVPWNLQWARRSHLYSFQNLTEWGLGLPLGILAWTGFLWMGWRILKGEWRQHLLLWSWTAIYFVWQSLQYNPTFRYQLPIYPLLAMMAGWAIIRLWEVGRSRVASRVWVWSLRAASVILGAVVLLLTAAWAYAFLHIYTGPEPRSAATEWIFQNIPGPINLRIKTPDGTNYQQPLPFSAGTTIQASAPYQTAFTAKASGLLDQVLLPHVSIQADLIVTVWQNPEDALPLASGVLSTPGSTVSASQVLHFDQPFALTAQQIYTLKVEVIDPAAQVNLCGPLELSVQTADGEVKQPTDTVSQCLVSAGQPYQAQFVPQSDGTLTQIDFGRLTDIMVPSVQTLSLSLAPSPDALPSQVLATASVTADFEPGGDPRGDSAVMKLDHPVPIAEGQTYYLRLETTGSSLTLSGASFANETDADYTIPFRTASYDPFGGIYRGDLNLEVYWDDNADKLERLTTDLDQADYLFLPTAHQVTQITRLPERYPLTTVYYRELLGCPADKDIIWCYKVAEPDMFHGSLGFDLVAVFTSYPTFGPLQINDQSAEEAFTFYDHPKTMIFKKNADYDLAKVQAILGAVDTSTAVRLTPGQADSYKSLMLPADRLEVQQAGGTWSQLFDWNAFQNKYPGLGVVLWYLVMFLVGLFAYPIVRTALPGLPDHGYPLARTAGLVIWAWFSWIAASFGVSYSKLTIGIALGLIALIGALLAYRQRQELKQEWQTKKKYFLVVEGLFLAFFLLDLLIRLGNPDIWHDPNGGERPMEFAYFNAVLKSTTFPPYDPWFAGGYINYYYYGYVIVGTPAKLLGIVPSIAYNFILPTLFACLALGGFSVAWNLLAGGQPDKKLTWKSFFSQRAFTAGMTGSAVMVLLGNLAIVRMFYRSFMCMAAPGSQLGGISIHDCIITPGSAVDKANIFTRLWWTIKGFFLTLGGQNLDATISNAREIFFGSTRVLPAASGGPITEFPLASFLWSDLHAHLMALGVTVLAIAWVLSVVLAKAKWKSHLDTALAFILGGLVIGALKPVNTWDFYTYLLMASIVLVYVVWRYGDVDRIPVNLPKWVKRLSFAVGAVALLAGLSLLFYQPFTHWYGQAYNSFEAWKGIRSDISSYLVHLGVFLFFIVSWMVWETREWMAATPVSSLRKLRPYRDLIIGGLVFLLMLLVLQQVWAMGSTQQPSWKGVTILWLALPLAAWAGALILRPGFPDTKKLVLFMVGTALVITMVVEILVVKGDVGRQNTVFKFYMQVWILLGVSAAAAFNWLLGEFRRWLPGWRAAWNMIASILVACSALFLLIYGIAKVRDRMSPAAPHTLDGMTYMTYNTSYFQYNQSLDLSEDYRAIRWMQENVQGSPVIAEAPSAGVQYTWLNRFSIYTGLPDVVGWEWHQIQQRPMFTDIVRERGMEENAFYLTTDVNKALDFLRKYNVRYVIIGQLERVRYTEESLDKFDVYNGVFWNEVYRDGQTVIYEVPPTDEVSP
jgi:YYY domain-containing protein